jgi:hypothetical protein
VGVDDVVSSFWGERRIGGEVCAVLADSADDDDDAKIPS